MGLTRDPARRPLRTETLLELHGRPVRSVPVLADPSPELPRRMPLAIRFAAACRRTRLAVPRGRIVQYQRFESIFASRPPPGRRAVCFLHNHPPDLAGRASDVRWRGLGGLLRSALGRALRRMDAVWTVDPRTRSWLTRSFPALPRVEAMPVWADPSRFQAGDAERRAADRRLLREGLGLPADAEVCLFAGRLEAQKDPLLLIRAWGRLAARRPGAFLVLVGEGRLSRRMRELARRLGVADRIRWRGYAPTDGLAALYRGADCTVCSSAFEAGPRSVFESLACGTLPVTFDVGQVSAVLEPLADLGPVVSERSEEALAAGLDRILGGPRPVERCVAAVAPFDPARALRPLFELYREWLRQPAPGPVRA